MNEKLIIDIHNFIQKLTRNVVISMYGIRDKNSIQLICQSLHQEVFGVELHPVIFDKAAYLWYALSNYDCFYNRNKRTALVTTYSYLRINGYCLKIENSFYHISLNIVESHIEKEMSENSAFQDVIVKLSQT